MLRLALRSFAGFGIGLVAFCGITSADTPARSPDLVLIFSDNFASGDVLNWSAEAGPVCPARLVAAGTVSGFVDTTAGNRVVRYTGSAGIGGPDPRRLVSIELYESFGGPMAPATVNLGVGDNTNYATCGTCVLHFYSASEPILFQSQGSLLISTLSPVASGTFAGTFSGTLIEVTIDPFTFVSTPVPGGCTLTEPSYPFSTTLTP